MYIYKIHPTTKMMEPMKQQKKKFGFNENSCLCVELHDAKSEQNIHRYKTNIYTLTQVSFEVVYKMITDKPEL